MEPTAVLDQAKDMFTAKRVIGDPYEKNGVTVIPVVAVGGGGGGGGGEAGGEGAEKQSGSGAGFGMRARPIGAYVIKGDSVRWLPAVDATRVIVGAQLVAIAAMLMIRSIVRSRTRRAKIEKHDG